MPSPLLLNGLWNCQITAERVKVETEHNSTTNNVHCTRFSKLRISELSLLKFLMSW